MARELNAGTAIPTLPLSGERTGSVYRYYVLAVIWVVLLLRFVDIQIVAVLLESIRAEFKVSDTQLGLLSGTAFALFYATLGLPIAWLADRYSRRTLIAVCLGVWSAMTGFCGMAGSFGTLLLARLGVGVGEAGGAPPSYSLVSDYFSARRRSTIFAFLNSAVPLGVFTGYIIGGYVNASLGWRATLLVIGAFGVIVALVLRLTVREPVRGAADGLHAASAPRFAETVRYLWQKRSYRHLVCAASIATLGATGSGIWIASFFIRVHHMVPVQVTTWLAFIYGGGGLIGVLLGGLLADRLSRSRGDSRWQAWLPSIAMISILPFSFFVYLWPNPITALLVQICTAILMHAWMGPCYGTVQSLAGPSRRAMAAAINQLVLNLLALGLGPLLVGVMSDHFARQFGVDSIRYSILVIVVVAYTWSAVHFQFAARSLRADLATAGSA
jgi:predicted MFS family arabinose efflux permease